MKKLIFIAIIAATAVSCKKIAPGGNLGRLKLHETQRYSEDEEGTTKEINVIQKTPETGTAVRTDSAVVAKPGDTMKTEH